MQKEPSLHHFKAVSALEINTIYFPVLGFFGLIVVAGFRGRIKPGNLEKIWPADHLRLLPERKAGLA